MIGKASYIVLAAASLGLLMFEAPRGRLLTVGPERGKVEQQATPTPTPTANHTVRSAHFVFIGGFHGGK